MCVIFNPIAARGGALRRIEKLRKDLGDRADFQATEGPAHAEELAFKATQSGFAVVAAAGGDGTLHEVANGVLRAGRPEVILSVFPLGSANDYAYLLGLTMETGLAPAAQRKTRQLDVGLVRSEFGKERYFVNSIGLGFSGDVTMEARRIRWLRGLPLYVLGFLRTLIHHYSCPVMEISFDQEVRRASTLSLTVAIGTREGNLLVTPKAVPDDGLFDYLHAGRLSRLEILRYMPRLATGASLPEDHPALWMGRCREVTLKSETPLRAHLDGEFFCVPEDTVHELEIRMLPGLLRVQV
jgi:diacylglycerol kinase family enzyme